MTQTEKILNEALNSLGEGIESSAKTPTKESTHTIKRKVANDKKMNSNSNIY